MLLRYVASPYNVIIRESLQIRKCIYRLPARPSFYSNLSTSNFDVTPSQSVLKKRDCVPHLQLKQPSVLLLRLNSTSKQAQNAPPDIDNDDPITAKNKSLFERFKESFKKYWFVLVPVHLVTSLAWFGGFYYLASIGVNPVPLLEAVGAPENLIAPLRNSKVGLVATAYALYKIATPARYAVTLGGTGLTVKMLLKRGYLPKPK